MKKIVLYMTMALMAALVSCKKTEDISTDAQEEQDCLVAIHPKGEITTSETPLSKATLTDDIYCVQVYKGSERFAIGYFDNIESMKLYLKKGSSYRIIVAMVKDAKNLLGSRYNLTQNSISNAGLSDVFVPFFGTSSNTSYKLNSTYFFPVNMYIYAFKNQTCYYTSSTSTSLSYGNIGYSGGYYFNNLGIPAIETGILGSQRYPTCTDWFYGEVNDYTPTGEYETMDMEFRRVGFKLKYELSGVTDGEVTVTIKNEIRTFISNTTNTATYASDTQFIAFYDAKSAWKYATDYSENMEVGVVWKRGIGVTQDLGKKVIQVKRNCLNNVKIALGNDDRGAGVAMTLESDASMDDANTDIGVQ